MFPNTIITISPNGDSRIEGMEGDEAMNGKTEKLQEVALEPIRPLFSLPIRQCFCRIVYENVEKGRSVFVGI